MAEPLHGRRPWAKRNSSYYGYGGGGSAGPQYARAGATTSVRQLTSNKDLGNSRGEGSYYY